MDLTRAQLHSRPLPAAANAPSHAQHSGQCNAECNEEQCLDYAAWVSASHPLGQLAANDLSTHHSKTTAQWHYRKTIGLKQSAGAIVVR